MVMLFGGSVTNLSKVILLGILTCVADVVITHGLKIS